MPLAVWHTLWLQRDVMTVPFIYTGIVVLLFILRIDAVRNGLRHLLRR